MNRKAAIVLLAAGCVLAFCITTITTAEQSGQDGKTGGTPDVTADATMKITSMSYYDRGGVAHPITLSHTFPGQSYSVLPSDIILKGTAYYKGPGGNALALIFNQATGENYASKLIPSGTTVSFSTPIALYLSSDTTLVAQVYGPGGSTFSAYYFTFTT